MPIGKFLGDLDPAPALGFYCLDPGGKFLSDQAFQERHVLQPAIIVLRKQIAQHGAALGFIGLEADKQGALVTSSNSVLGQQLLDVIRRVIIAALDRLPDLFLPGRIARDRESHELIERHLVGGIDFQ